jgi:hypothetical protein
MKIKGQCFENDGSYFRVYRITHNRELTRTFVHFHKVSSPLSTNICGRDRYYTEELPIFLKEYSNTNDEPPPIPNHPPIT